MVTRKVATPAKKIPVKTASAPAKKQVKAKAPAAAAAPAASAVTAAPPKAKHKLVRDSFTIPKAEYVVLDTLKKRAAALARPVKKSELLRAGIAALNAMSDSALLEAINTVPELKTGRPKHVKAVEAIAVVKRG